MAPGAVGNAPDRLARPAQRLKSQISMVGEEIHFQPRPNNPGGEEEERMGEREGWRGGGSEGGPLLGG